MYKLVLAVAVVWLAGCLLSAQEPQQRPASFVSRTDLVVVPIVVNDGSGKAVRGLTQTDFRLFDSGREQKIASFEEVSAPTTAMALTPPRDGIYTNRVAAGQPPIAFGIVLLDRVNTSALNLNQYWAIRGLLNFLDRWKGQTGFRQPMMVGVITRAGLQIIHEATTDPVVLEQAIELMRLTPAYRDSRGADRGRAPEPLPNGSVRVPPQPRRDSDVTADMQALTAQVRLEVDTMDRLSRADNVIIKAQDEADARTTLAAVHALANAVAGIPGRKALIWLSEVFPFAQHIEASSPIWAAQWDGATEEAPDVERLRAATLLALNRAMISVYPVNVEGVMAPDFFSTQWGAFSINNAPRASLRGTDGERHTKQISDPRFVADQTGGLQCMNSNNIADCVNRAIEESGHYYLLSYYPDPRPEGEGWRKLKVQVQRPRLSVRARNSYYVGVHGPRGNARQEVTIALQSKLDYSGLPLAVRWTRVSAAGAGRFTAEFEIGIDGRALTVDEPDNNRVSLLYGVLADDNTAMLQPVDTRLKTSKLGDIRSTRLIHAGQLEFAPGKHEVRFVVRDNLSGQIGSVVVPLTVQ